MPIFQERRQFSRAKVEWPASISSAHGLIEGTIKNISLEDVYMHLDGLPDMDEALDLSMEIPEHHYSVITAAKLVRFDIHDSDGFLYVLGVRLVEISNRNRLLLSNAILYSLHFSR